MKGIVKAILLMDFLIYEGFQKFTTWFQKLTGITCFQLAKFFAKIVFVALTLDYIKDFFRNISPFSLATNTFFWLFYSWFLWRTLLLCEALDEKYANGFNFVNDLIFDFLIVIGRMALLFFVILYGTLLSFVSNKVFFWSFMPFWIALIAAWFCAYFIVCTPLPPSKSKVKTWLKKAKDKAQGIFLPAPEPSGCSFIML